MAPVEEGAPEECKYDGPVNAMPVRTFEEEMKYITKLTPWKYEIAKGFVPGMRVEGTFYVNDALIELITDELKHHCTSGGYGGFLPAVKQVNNNETIPVDTIFTFFDSLCLLAVMFLSSFPSCCLCCP